jgi:hypothetical protein
MAPVKRIRVVCIDPGHAPLTRGKAYEVRREANPIYYSVINDDGQLTSYLTHRFQAEKPQRKSPQEGGCQ